MSEREPNRSEASADKVRAELKASAEQKISSERQTGQTVDREAGVEKAREQLKTQVERPKPTERRAETAGPKPPRRVKATKADRQAAYAATMQQVRSQLPPAARAFSRFVHARPVEAASEFLEETIYRPSFLIVGGLGALIFGTGMYLVAYSAGFALSGSEFSISLLVGGVIGLVTERLWRVLRR